MAEDITNLVTTTPTRFTVIRPELLPPMQVLQSISTEQNIDLRMAKFKELWAFYDPPYAAQYDVDQLEFDPIRIQAELAAYFELLVRDRVNQAARAITMVYAVGGDLDAIGSRYPYGIPRLQFDADGNILTQAQIDAGAVVVSVEDDVRYRMRLWLSPSILSLSGPGQSTYESYVFWAMSTPMPAGEKPIRHASIFTKRATGHVFIVIMRDETANETKFDITTPRPWAMVTTYAHNPTPSVEQINTVADYINDKKAARKGLTDWISVLRPKIINIDIRVKVWLFPGVDRDTLMNEVMASVKKLVEDVRWLGADITMLALETALGRAGVYNVVIESPVGDVIAGQDGVIVVKSITLIYQGVGE